MLRLETLRTVILRAEVSFGKVKLRLRPLALIVMPPVEFANWVSIFRRAPLFVISMLPTVIKLIPSRVLKKVLVMVTLFAFEMNEGKVSCDRAGRDDQLMVPTAVRSVNERVDNRVKLNMLKVPPIAPIELLVKEVKPPALLTIRSPVI